MDITEFLNRRNTDISAIVANVQGEVGLEPSDALLAVGSLAEGLGNSKSDLDLFLITPRDTNLIKSCELALVVGKCLSDLQIVPITKLQELLVRLESWAKLPWDVTHAANFTVEERRLLHRLLHCLVLFEGTSSQITTQLPKQSNLARLKLHVARHMSRTVQVDMAGNRESGDYPSLVFAAQDLLGYATDALTATYQFTNPTAKWRSRILEQLPADWERALGTRLTGLTALELIWRLHRAPELPDEKSALEHALRIATFARAVFASSERRLVHGISDAQVATAWPLMDRESRTQNVLPYLDLDVDFCMDNEGVSIARLNEFDDPMELSPREFAIALLFDGMTTVHEAEIMIYGFDADEVGRSALARIISRVTELGLSIPPGNCVAKFGSWGE